MNLDDLARRWAPTHPRLRGDLPSFLPFGKPDDEKDDKKDDEDEDRPTGVMVAFYPSAEAAAGLALGDLDGDLVPEPAGELHLTLAYLGKVGAEFDEVRTADLVQAVTAWARRSAVVNASTYGIGLFDTEDGPVTWASVDSPELPAVRQALLRSLASAGMSVTGGHGFTPHITLCWGDCRNIDVPAVPLVFDTVSVVVGGDRTDIPLGVPGNDEDLGKLDSLGRPKANAILSRDRMAFEGERRETARSAALPFVVTVGRHTVVTAAAATWDGPLSRNEHMLWIQGRFVGAETPNRNNAYWSSEDLEMGLPSVSYGPLNWLHEERHIIGAIADSRFVPRGKDVETAAETTDPHIVVAANVWRWIYPEEASVIEMAAEAGSIWISMECLAEKVGCVGVGGCGQEYSYDDYQHGLTCDHLREHSSVRRFVNPTFLGGGIIVPPSKPGWVDADMRILAGENAARTYDQAGRPDIPAARWDQVVAGAVGYARSLGG